MYIDNGKNRRKNKNKNRQWDDNIGKKYTGFDLILISKAPRLDVMRTSGV